MTRAVAIHRGGTAFDLRPPKALIPAPVATALAAYDDLVARQALARVRGAELSSDEALAKADALDNAAVAGAIAASQPIPAPENRNKLLKDLEDSRRELLGFETAITNARNTVSSLSSKAADTSGYKPDVEHAAMVETVAGHLAAAAQAFEAFANREVLQAWLNGASFVPRTAVTVNDIVVMERPRTMDNRTEVPVAEILDGVVNALRKGK